MEFNEYRDYFTVFVHDAQLISLRQRAPVVPCNYPERCGVLRFACLSPSPQHIPWAAPCCSHNKLLSNVYHFFDLITLLI